MNDRRPIVRVTEPVKMPNGSLGWMVKTTVLLIPHQDLEAWGRLQGVTLLGWQIAAIQLIDEYHAKVVNDPPAPSLSPSKDDKDKSGWLSVLTAMGVRKPS